MKRQPAELEGSVASVDSTPARTLDRERGLPGVIVGRLAGFHNTWLPLVDFPSNTSGRLLEARSAQALRDEDIGKEVVLMFEDGDLEKPIIISLIETSPRKDPLPPATHGDTQVKTVAVTRDNDTLVLTAEREITLRCGKSSITLTRAGKVLIRGEYLLSRSSGVNRIKGGSVQIN